MRRSWVSWLDKRWAGRGGGGGARPGTVAGAVPGGLMARGEGGVPGRHGGGGVPGGSWRVLYMWRARRRQARERVICEAGDLLVVV